MQKTAVPAAPPSLDKVLELLTGRNSKDLHERHLAAIERLCNSSPEGFAIRDLPKVQQILEITVQLVLKGYARFLESAVKLIRTATKPFVRKTSTDEFRLLGHISSFLKCIGDLFGPQIPTEIKTAASEMLFVFATGYGNRPSVLDKLPNPQELDTGAGVRQYLVNQTLIASSGAVQAVVRGLASAILSANEVLMMSLTMTLGQFSYHPDNVAALLEAGILPCLPHLLGFDFRHPLVPVAVELLWNMLDLCPAQVRAALAQQQPSVARVMAGGAGPQDEIPAVSAAGATSQGSPSAMPQGTGSQQEGAGNQVTLQQGATDQQTGEEGGLGGTTDTTLGFTSPKRTISLPTVPGVVLPDLAHALAALIQGTLLEGFRMVDKELRNDILVVANLILGSDHDSGVTLPHASGPGHTMSASGAAASPSSLPQQSQQQPGGGTVATSIGSNTRSHNDCGTVFALAAYEAGLFDTLLAVSTTPEFGVSEHPGLVKAWALTTEELDYELKHLAWRCVVTACSATGPSGPVLPLATSWGLTRALLAFVEPNPEASASQGVAAAATTVSRRWSHDQATALREAALVRLHALAPLCPEVFLSEDGPATLLRLLSAGVAPAHVEAALRQLHRLVESAAEMAEALGMAGVVAPLLGLLQDASMQAQGIRHSALLLLASLCRHNTENLRRLRHEGGVAALLAQLERAKAADPTLPSPVTVAVLDAVWAAIVPDRKNTARFLVEDGLDKLCDLLESGNRGHRSVLLSLLCDLLENPRSHSFFHEWRSSRNQQTAAHLLLSIWGEEDAARGLTVDGLLANTQRPLDGTGHRTRWIPSEAIAYSSIMAATTIPPHEDRASGGTLASAATTASVRNSTAVQQQVMNSSTGGALSSGGSQGRAAAVATMLSAASGESVLAKIYGCFHLLGFGNFGYLPPTDTAVLTLVEKYVKFKQGEVWSAIHAEFEATGMRPTAPDRERLASGIELSQSLARAVREAQAAILRRDAEEAAAREKKFFDDMRAQRQLEQEARFFKKDKSQLTMAELREAKQKKEQMLRNSIRDFKVLMDASSAEEVVTAEAEAEAAATQEA